jgi:hypothetical protein
MTRGGSQGGEGAVSAIPSIRITLGTDKGHEVKTSSSRRDVPLHPALIAEGFLEWVARRPNGPLFCHLPPGRYGKRGDAASRRYGRWQRNEVGITDRKAVAHSRRHRMEDSCARWRRLRKWPIVFLGIPRRENAGLQAPPPKVKAKWIAKFPAVKAQRIAWHRFLYDGVTVKLLAHLQKQYCV